MRSMRFSRACTAALFATLLLTTVTALAKDGRDFAGFYKVSHARIQGDQVHLTLNLQIHNNGDADATHAVITLRQNTGFDVVGSTRPIALVRLHDHVNVSQQFTVSRREYEKWHNGSQPGLSITYRANGKTWERPMQMAARDF
jgi:hypothetical protein